MRSAWAVIGRRRLMTEYTVPGAMVSPARSVPSESSYAWSKGQNTSDGVAAANTTLGAILAM